ncbi:uncharacterized protein LOC129579226 isoform X2 [Sitodiplosis mosellana]|uniref:uncharacterized protein LOC129579226 isoform X2 n=1 Tax=Sitodiplosis mosellana TaxID=263140 RepID=UPI0024444E2C|nr:uncharacterized protein LOC129579226 isoform X2 [Sitodiplosis mosellana]
MLVVRVFCFWLANEIFCCIVSISAIKPLPTSDACENNYTPFCELRNCKNVYTNNIEHREFIELSSNHTTDLLLEFYVIGSSDCHVHLSPVVNPNQTNYGVYDFLIGGFNNSRTVVKHGRKIFRDLRTANVLSESQPVQFRIEIIPSGVIQIYRNDLLLLETLDRNVAPVRYFNFATDDHLNGMYFYYDCKHASLSAKNVSADAPDDFKNASASAQNITIDDDKHVSSSAENITTDAHLKVFVLVALCIRLTLFSYR